MASYSDNFNRASLGANWTEINGGTWGINASTTLRQSQSAFVYRGLRWDGGAFASNNFYARVTAQAQAGQGFGVLVRCPTTGTALADIDGYAIVGFAGDQWYRVEFTDGSDAGYVGMGGTCAANTNYTIETRAEGSTITVLLNGSQLAQWTDTTYASGGAMLVSFGATVIFDNFEAGDLIDAVVGIATIAQVGDTLAASGVQSVVGTMTGTQAGSAASGVGLAALTGVLTAPQAHDEATTSGELRLTGVVDSTQTKDGLISIASSAITGAGIITRSSDAVMAIGAVGVAPLSGVAGLAQDVNDVVAAGSAVIRGVLVAQQSQHVLIVVGILTVAGESASAQVNNILAAVGIIGDVPATGSAAIAQAGNTAIVVGATNTVGSLANVQKDNAIGAVGSVALWGAGSANQAGNKLIGFAALDLVLAIVIGAVRGVRGTGSVNGVTEQGIIAGGKQTGSVR